MDYSQLGNKRRKRLQNPHTTRVRNKIGLLILRITLAVVLIGGFAGVGAVMGIYIGILNAAPKLDISQLGPISPHSFGANGGAALDIMQSSFIISARTGEELERLHDAHNHEFAGLGVIPQHLIYAFVAIEDERFFEHNGVDPRGIARAIYVTTLPDRPTEGASTITQQLIKNMLRVQDNTFITKLQEQHLAINFERFLVDYFAAFVDEDGNPIYEDPRAEAKNFIIQSYLNIIYLGRQNIGVQAAAWFYYNICVSELSIAQAATIASITQHPSRFPPDIRPEANWTRTVQVLNSMLRLGFINEEEHYEARRERRFINPVTGLPAYDEYDEDGNPIGEPVMVGYVYDTIFRTADGRTRNVVSEFDCFTDSLIDQVRDDLMRVLGLTRFEANRRLFTGGLRIYSTQCMEKQAIVDRAFLDDSLWPGPDVGFFIEVRYQLSLFNTITQQPRHYERMYDADDLEAAEAFIERIKAELITDTDEVLSERYFKVPQPQAAFTLLEQHTGHVLAIRGIRGPKEGNRAFSRATSPDMERSPGSQLKPLIPFGPLFDTGVMQPSTVIDDIPFLWICPYGGRNWEPSNWYHNPPFRGLQTARMAIYDSLNVVSARAGSDPSIVHAGVPMMKRFLEQLGIEVHAQDGPSMVLGGLRYGVRVLDLAGAYAAVANGGEFIRPVLYTMVLDHNGNILLDNTRELPRRVMRDTTAYLISHAMRQTVTDGTGWRANWESAALRAGMPIASKTGTSQDRRDLGFVGFTPYFTAAIWMGNDNFQPMHRDAGRYHTPVWRIIMEEIHLELEPRQFERPARIVTAQVCLDSGHLPTDLCRIDPRGNRVRTEVFEMGLVPTIQCGVHQRFTYCRLSGALATAHCSHYTRNEHGEQTVNVVTRVGIVRPNPIDDIENVVIRDRVHEFPIGVRYGLSCTTCGFDPWLDQGAIAGIIWCDEIGWYRWVPDIRPYQQPTPPVINGDGDIPGEGGGLPVIPPPDPVYDRPPEWGGLGPPGGGPPPGQQEGDFVGTVVVPGLDDEDP